MSEPSVAVLVVNFGSSELLRQNLLPLGRRTSASIVVVDNLSTELERARISRLAEDEGWTLVTPGANFGFGGGMNLAAARAIDAGAEVLVLLNPDARLDPDALRSLATEVSEEPGRAVSPRVLRPDGSVWFAGSDLHLLDGRIRSPRRRKADDDVFPWLSGACLAVSRELWERVGGFDESYFLYWEDVDISWRIVATGGSLAVLDDISVVHDEGGTHRQAGSRPEAKSTTYYYYNIRNRLLFARRNLDSGAQKRWRANDVGVAWEILLQGGRRQFLKPLGPLSTAVRAVRDGRQVGGERAASSQRGALR